LTDIDIFLCVYVPVETYQSQTQIVMLMSQNNAGKQNTRYL